MNAHCRFALGFFFTAALAIPFAPPAARADDDWEDRWEDYYEELEEQREEHEERMEDRRESLQDYWQAQREAQSRWASRRGHAWFGSYGPYYGGPGLPNNRVYGPREFFAPALQSGCYGYASGAPRHDHGCEPASLGCHDDRHGGSLSIGSFHVFWQ
jgi:hypothetical protein